ncbi:ChbG/HpnK family deacetylase [Paenibacillus chitinolyticus]|uniref:ChbG/HpnK family deacetylase n=1 Tax=Paenibacillus chitinolyticus TaxID=79263 RepID=A0A410WRL0_9BACL|nr:polysaccharide deacetylase family protein [Paenibacillus chitinolyticus]MCY9592156.1 polysaccharide deacetylase family protein [Paenibacillus chitinolyticus]MCY9598456.1 polysaccharide deacetylase family protein [Paenibacillus chitinolyticus]QAV16983.1 ChbG/HpnK family deacetylase [Paenibacillus chitinolyticus]
MSLAEALGYRPDEKLLIVNADDYGMCHAANEGIAQLLAEGAVSSATVMMPCGWAKEAVEWAAAHPQTDVGVHLTFTSEWTPYKWGPVTRHGSVASLVTQEGYFPADSASFERRADPEEVRTEIVSQIELAMRMGVMPTHLDNHMGSLYGLGTGRDFLGIVFDICASYGLPFRIPRYVDMGLEVPAEAAKTAGLRAAQADAKGVVILDYLLGLPFHMEKGETYESFRGSVMRLLRALKPGVSEFILHPALPAEELKAINPHWQKREWEFRLFRDPEIKGLLAAEGIRLIGWSELQRLQRASR